ncbi:hypothetical protein [Pseudactinotalea suaedae]|uniref:hypothetical protein n=1 Tax=Pseudactinotalea suaedae TaxID=1524924 RepID=UPI0012E25D60|nr:hypothetical protein [Pseudactinotalea suaedae]
MTHDVPPWGSPEPDRQEPVLGQPDPVPALTCPACSGVSFSEEEGRMQTRWGMGSHIFTIRVCNRCRHALLFHQGGGMAF